MLSKITGWLINVLMLATMYYGVHKGNELVSNGFWFVFWLLLIVAISALVTLFGGDAKDTFKGCKSKSKFECRAHVIYDFVFSVALAMLGHWVLASIYLASNFVLIYKVQEVTKEIEKDNK